MPSLIPSAVSGRARRVVACVAATCALAGGAWAAPARGADDRPPLLLDGMDSPAPTLKLIEPGPQTRIVSQQIVPDLGADGGAAERIVLAVPAGRSAYLAYDLPPIPAVIPEVRLAATIRCNLPGAQLAAMVVLPHAPDPKTAEPRRLLIRSGKMASAGAWQQVVLDGLPDLLADHARVVRAKDGGAVDEREAYVAQLVILVPGGAGGSELAVDQIAVHGVLAPQPAASPLATSPSHGVVPAAATGPVAAAPSARRPLVPRIIQWQGEPLELVRRIGFDAVAMGRLPTAQELADAARLGLFIVCPPPLPEALASRRLGPEFDAVLAWDLGRMVDAADVPAAHRWAQAIEQAETRPDRPVVLQPYGMPREASRIADVLRIGRPRIGSSQTWPEYAAALSQQRRLARPGVPLWIDVQTHCGPRFMAQLAALREGRGASIVPATFSDLSHATTAAFGVAPRGFYFQSHVSLASGDVENQQRALALELTNMRLGLAEPWLAAGKTAVAARSSRPELTGLVLKVERSHLIIPLLWAEAALPPLGAGQPLAVSFDLPGVPESCDAYVVSIAGSQRLPGRRVTGGLRITIDRLPDDAFVLVTEDGYAFSHVERYLREHAPRAAQVRVELAALRRQQAAQALARAPAEAVAASGARDDLARVDAQLTAVVDTMRRRDLAAAFACAAEAERLLDAAAQRLAAAMAPSLTPGTSPVPLDWATMSELAHVERAATPNSAAVTVIPGAEFDSLDLLLESGWQRVQNTSPGVETAVRLSPAAPASGAYCLELDAHTPPDRQTPPILPAPPVWVTSPPIAVPPGSLVEISGMVRVGEQPIGSSDPLLIFDTAGGEESALRVRSAPSWTPFRLLRAAAPNGELRVTIALAGVGVAQVDALHYRFIPLRADAIAQAPRQNP